MSIWPEGLPSPLVEGYKETMADTAVRTQMDSGPAKMRPRTTAGVVQIEMSFLLSRAQLEGLEDFYKIDLSGGTTAFDYTHPRRGDTVTARFARPPEVASQNGEYFRVAIVLEVLP